MLTFKSYVSFLSFESFNLVIGDFYFCTSSLISASDLLRVFFKCSWINQKNNVSGGIALVQDKFYRKKNLKLLAWFRKLFSFLEQQGSLYYSDGNSFTLFIIFIFELKKSLNLLPSEIVFSNSVYDPVKIWNFWERLIYWNVIALKMRGNVFSVIFLL